MKARHPAPLSSVLSSDGGLSTLVERAGALDILTRDLRQQLPADLSEHLAIANIRGRTVVLVADSAGWATRARYLRTQVLNLLRERHGLQVDDLKVKVAVARDQAESPKSLRRPQMTPETARNLTQLADAERDPELAAALRRLARRGDER